MHNNIQVKDRNTNLQLSKTYSLVIQIIFCKCRPI